MAPKTLGYARTNHGVEILPQITALTEAGCIKVFADEHTSAADMDRPGLCEALAALAPGDTLMVEDATRLARSISNHMAVRQIVEQKGARLTFLGQEKPEALPSESGV